MRNVHSNRGKPMSMPGYEDPVRNRLLQSLISMPDESQNRVTLAQDQGMMIGLRNSTSRQNQTSNSYSWTHSPEEYRATRNVSSAENGRYLSTNIDNRKLVELAPCFGRENTLPATGLVPQAAFIPSSNPTSNEVILSTKHDPVASSINAPLDGRENEKHESTSVSPDSCKISHSLSGSTKTAKADSSDSSGRPIRQPRGPRHAKEDKGFDWWGHAKLQGRPNLYTSSSVRTAGIPSRSIVSGESLTLWQTTSTQYAAFELGSTADTSLSEVLGPLQRPNTRPPLQIPPNAVHQIPTLHTSRPGHFTQYDSLTPHGRVQSCSATQLEQKTIQRPFVPSTMALTAAGLASRDPARQPQGSSYLGDAFAGSYLHRVEGLPDHLNCGIWMKGLPPNVKHSQVFDLIRCGSVWSLYLKPPTTEHPTVAVQLAFMSPQAAAWFMNHYHTYGFILGGYSATCHYDKYGSPAHSTSETRVLRIEGPEAFMTPQAWDAQFSRACTFQMDRWSYLDCNSPGRLRMEFQFSRVDGQAQTCRQMIERNLACYGISVWYGPDPCGQVGY